MTADGPRSSFPADSDSSPFRDILGTIDFVRPGVDLGKVTAAPPGSTLEEQKKIRDQTFVAQSVRVVDARRGPGRAGGLFLYVRHGVPRGLRFPETSCYL